MPVKRRKHGKGIKEVLGKIHSFIKNNRLISRGASTLAPLAGSYSGHVSAFGNAASALGYGRKKRRRRGRPRKK